MRRLLFCAALVAAAARPLAAETFLYATAASQRRLDGFRVRNDGSLAPDPSVRASVAGRRPRRLVARGCTLYVAESDRVEVFRVDRNGQLTLIGATHPSDEMRAHDVALAADGQTLYVPFRVSNRIASYPLGPDGVPNVPPTEEPTTQGGVPFGAPTSCLYGPASGDMEDLVVANGKLYATFFTGVHAYGIDAEGKLIGAPRVVTDQNGNGEISDNEQENPICVNYNTTPEPPLPCVTTEEERPKATCPSSRREQMNGATGLLVDGTALFTGDRLARRLLGFTLQDDGNFPPISADPSMKPTPEEKKQQRKLRKANRTGVFVRYLGLAMVKPADAPAVIYAVTFRGQVDAFRLNDDGTLPKLITASTHKDVRSSPTRTAIRPSDGTRKAVLYLAGGEVDRIQAFRLNDNGVVPPDATPFSETRTLPGSFPNDVVLVDADACS